MLLFNVYFVLQQTQPTISKTRSKQIVIIYAQIIINKLLSDYNYISSCQIDLTIVKFFVSVRIEWSKVQSVLLTLRLQMKTL